MPTLAVALRVAVEACWIRIVYELKHLILPSPPGPLTSGSCSYRCSECRKRLVLALILWTLCICINSFGACLYRSCCFEMHCLALTGRITQLRQHEPAACRGQRGRQSRRIVGRMAPIHMGAGAKMAVMCAVA